MAISANNLILLRVSLNELTKETNNNNRREVKNELDYSMSLARKSGKNDIINILINSSINNKSKH
jgi:hypothetical protein